MNPTNATKSEETNGGDLVAALDSDTNLREKVAIKRHDFLFKIILLGDTQTGKTNILNRFVDEKFEEESLPTIGVDFKTKIIHVRDKAVKLQIWDTAGKKKFESVSELFYRGAMGVVYCFDLTNKQTFKNIDKWVHKISGNPHFIDSREQCFSVLVGCKSDLVNDREVTQDKGQEFAIRFGAQYFEISSKTGENIDVVFQNLSNLILSNKLGWNPDPRLSARTSGGSRQTPRPSSVMIRTFSERAGSRTRSLRRSFRRRSTRPKANEVDENGKRRRRFSESDLPIAVVEKEPLKGKKKHNCAIL